MNDSTPETLDEAQAEYEEIMKTDDAKDLLAELKNSLHYTLEPDMTYVSILKDVKNNSFNREKGDLAQTIEELYGPCLHSYTIKEAI